MVILAGALAAVSVGRWVGYRQVRPTLFLAAVGGALSALSVELVTRPSVVPVRRLVLVATAGYVILRDLLEAAVDGAVTGALLAQGLWLVAVSGGWAAAALVVLAWTGAHVVGRRWRGR